MTRSRVFHPHAVTFDCWATLLFQTGAGLGRDARAQKLAELVGVQATEATEAVNEAWRRHQLCWHRRQVFGASDIVARALATLGVEASAGRVMEIVKALEPIALAQDVRMVPGAREALLVLARAGVRRALICDTGFSSGQVVRRLLERHGLLELLETTVFSDEVGVPKPHPRAFLAALGELGVQANEAVHVGDLKRSDVAGARGVGMGSVRLTAHHDDRGSGAGAGVVDCTVAGCTPPCDRPEADVIVGSYPELLQILGYAP